MPDITFCAHKECTARECMRHFSHIPTDTAVSVSMFDCPYMPLDFFNGYVEVVHCKDCKHRYYNEDREVYCCEVWADGYDTEVRDDDFCSYGERREDNAAD